MLTPDLPRCRPGPRFCVLLFLVFGGALEFKIAKTTQQSNAGASGEKAVTEIILRDTRGRFAELDTMQIYLEPSLHMWERTANDSRQARDSQNDFVNVNEGNVVTLKRQADGTFAAFAPEGRAWVTQAWQWQLNEGTTIEPTGLEFCFVTPSGEWVTNGDRQNFKMPF